MATSSQAVRIFGFMWPIAFHSSHIRTINAKDPGVGVWRRPSATGAIAEFREQPSSSRLRRIAWCPDKKFSYVAGDLVDYLSRDDVAQVEHSLSCYFGLLR